jgi:hypothetical protein
MYRNLPSPYGVKLYQPTRPEPNITHITSVIKGSNLRRAEGELNYSRSKDFSCIREHGGEREGK